MWNQALSILPCACTENLGGWVARLRSPESRMMEATRYRGQLVHHPNAEMRWTRHVRIVTLGPCSSSTPQFVDWAQSQRTRTPFAYSQADMGKTCHGDQSRRTAAQSSRQQRLSHRPPTTSGQVIKPSKYLLCTEWVRYGSMALQRSANMEHVRYFLRFTYQPEAHFSPY